MTTPFFFEPNLARASTLPASWYTDPLRLETERTAVFHRTWQFAGSLQGLAAPGSYATVAVCNLPLILTRDTQGVLRAFHNVCRHRAGVVAVGSGSRPTLQCQYHGWLYGLDGSLKNCPEFEGVENFSKSDLGLFPIRTSTWGGFVFVNFSNDAPALEEYLGRIPEETRAIDFDTGKLVERREYIVDCNWKVYVDNYLEGYHLPIAHPSLYREVDYDRYRVETFRYYSTQHAPIRPLNGSAEQRIYPPQAGDRPAFFYWLFPNFMLNIYPDNLQLNVVIPETYDRTKVLFEWYALGANPKLSATIQRSIELGEEVQTEDVGLCEGVWKNLMNGVYSQGRYSVKRENGVHHFHGLLAEFVAR